MNDIYTIERSKNGAYYTLKHNNQVIGNYDTVTEAVKDLEKMKADEE